MSAPTDAQIRERAKKAKEMFEAVSGHAASMPESDSPIECAQLHIASALAYAEAALAVLTDAGPAAVGFWENVGGIYASAAQICDES